jgi:hypothetical protein
MYDASRLQHKENADMVEYLKTLEDQACTWPGVTAQPHRFGGRVFRLGRSEVGHVHNDGAVEIPLPLYFRDELVAEGLAEKHHTCPNSGWITFHVRSESDVFHATRLLWLSYLRFALKAVPDPVKRFEQESERLGLSPRIRAALERFVPEGEKEAA